MHMRVLLFRVFFVIPVYSFLKGRLRVEGENPLFAHSVCVFKHVSSAQTILRSSFAASAFADAFFVYYSRIVFGYFSQKSTFIKIGYLKEIFVTVTSTVCLPCQMPLSISFTSLVKFLYTLAQVPKCHIADNQHLSYFGTPFE